MSKLQLETIEKIKSLNDENLILVSDYIDKIKSDISSKMIASLRRLQENAKNNGTLDMSLDEINKEIYGEN